MSFRPTKDFRFGEKHIELFATRSPSFSLDRIYMLITANRTFPAGVGESNLPSENNGVSFNWFS